MNKALVIIGLIVVAILVLIPIVAVSRVLIAITRSYFEHRRAEAGKITRSVPGLGDFSSYDGHRWFGVVDGLQVFLVSPGQPPTEEQSRHVQAVLQDRSRWVQKAKTYLAAHENVTLQRSGAEAFELEGLDFANACRVTLELGHPGDPDGMYQVEFDESEAVACVRND